MQSLGISDFSAEDISQSSVDVIFGIVVLLGILGLGREYVLRVELEVLHESSTRKVVYTEEDNLKEGDSGDKPRRRPPHDLLPLLHHIEVVYQLILPAKKVDNYILLQHKAKIA